MFTLTGFSSLVSFFVLVVLVFFFNLKCLNWLFTLSGFLFSYLESF